MRRFTRVLLVASLAGGAALIVPSTQRPELSIASSRPEPSPTSLQAATLTTAAVTAKPAAVTGSDAVAIPGVVMERQVSLDVNRPVSVSWPRVPNATSLSALLDRWARAQEQRFLRETTPGGLRPPELAIDGDIIQAHDAVVGVRMRSQQFGSGQARTMTAVFYANVERDEAWSGGELVDTTAVSAISSAAAAAARSAYPDRDLSNDSADVLMSSAILTAQGDLEVTLPARGDLVHVTLPALQVRPALSPRGLNVLASLNSGKPYAAPPASSTPSVPPPVPTAHPTVTVVPTGPPLTAPAVPKTLAGPKTPVDCATVPCVALTYDDGPGPYTDRLLDTLAAANVKATFFVLGRSVTAYPDALRREAAMGMAIGNHTWSHRDMRRLTQAESRTELGSTGDLVASLTGMRPTLMRPPYGAYDEQTRTLGMPIIWWDVDTEDWRNRSAAVTTERALAAVRPGSIILMHDVHPTTVDAAPGLIAALRARGFVFVTVPEILGHTQPGVVYFSRSRSH